MAIVVSPAVESKVRNLAAKVNPMFRWKYDGPKVLAIIDLLIDDLRTASGRRPGKRAAVTFIAGIVLDLDDTLGWDAPDQSEAIEDRFFTWLVEARAVQRWGI